MQPFVCRKCNMKNCWGAIHAHPNGILIVIPWITIVWKDTSSHYWHPRNLSTNNYLHPHCSISVNFWTHARQVKEVLKEIGISQCSASTWQRSACRFVHWFSIYTPWLPHLSWSSSFSPISMTYHKQFSKSRQCAPGLCREWSSLLNDWMQHDSCNSSQLVWCFEHPINHSYDITHLDLVR